MADRWVPVFLSTLSRMEQLGDVGSSRYVTIMSDGDGDFRPKFKWDNSLPPIVGAAMSINGDNTYDAG